MNWSGGLDVRDIAVICGPTAAGKSSIAMAIARQADAVIIGADSRQVYRGFDIGTAKPSAADRESVVHRGIDIIAPTERYSAARWAESAHEWLGELKSASRRAIVVGGTGFYMRALDVPLFVSPPLDAAARARVQAALAVVSTEALRARCQEVDATRAHLGRTQLLRALEIFELTGRPLSAWQRESTPAPVVRSHYLLVDPGDALRTRIAERIDAMLAAGWEAEVETLSSSVAADAPAWNACGYSLVRAMLAGDLSRRHAVERSVIATRQYAKRQRTWFRHQLPSGSVTLLDPGAPGSTGRAMDWFESVSMSEHR